MMIIVMLAVILGANFYVFFRLWHMLPQGNPLRWVLLVFGVVAVSSMFIAVLLGNHIPQGLTGFLYKLGTSWVFIMMYFVMLFLVLDIARLCGAPLDRFLHSWIGLLASVGIVAVVIIAGNIKYYDKKRVELDLKVEKELPSGGLKIVALSDLHIGYTISKSELAKWVELINAENPDIVLIAGDITDKRAARLSEDGYASEFHKIRSKYGVYAVLGNHEYINDVNESLAFLRESGMTVLRDSVALVDSLFYVVGRDDRTNSGRAELAGLTGGLDASLPVILLDHQPYHLEEAENNGVDLQFSGHTHRGQAWPISWLVDSMYEKAHGYLKKGDTHYFVSSGMGIWGGKYRIGTQSEYLVITLREQ